MADHLDDPSNGKIEGDGGDGVAKKNFLFSDPVCSRLFQWVMEDMLTTAKNRSESSWTRRKIVTVLEEVGFMYSFGSKALRVLAAYSDTRLASEFHCFFMFLVYEYSLFFGNISHEAKIIQH